MSSDQGYPGEQASARDLLRLADEYHRAAIATAALGRKGEPLSRAPYRLVAIHALELYLSTHLLHLGEDCARVRGLQHDLGARAELAMRRGLKLRKRTAAHLRSVSGSREYLITRYGPERLTRLSQINRLAATLDEVASKVRASVGRAGDVVSRRVPPPA